MNDDDEQFLPLKQLRHVILEDCYLQATYDKHTSQS